MQQKLPQHTLHYHPINNHKNKIRKFTFYLYYHTSKIKFYQKSSNSTNQSKHHAQKNFCKITEVIHYKT
mgnify:CR=1 FL=1